MANEQKTTKTVETKRIVGTNLYRALAEFETAVRAGWALEPRGTTTVGSIVYINLVRGSKVSKEEEVVITETPLDAEIKDGVYKAEGVPEVETTADATVDVPVKKTTRKAK